jgi:hypothetical protein
VAASPQKIGRDTLAVVDQGQRWQTLNQGAYRNSRLETRQLSPKAHVNPETECEVPTLGSIELKLVGVREDALIPVRGCIDQVHLGALGDDGAVQADVPGGGARETLGR